jgi:hypothetical protein
LGRRRAANGCRNSTAVAVFCFAVCGAHGVFLIVERWRLDAC